MSSRTERPSPVSDPLPTRSDSSPFRAFGPAHFKRWPAWHRLDKILSSNGGSFGLSGPRGAGKSWLMLHAVDTVRNNDGIAVWYPSPSEYDSHAFLASLTASLAKEVEHVYGNEGRRQSSAASGQTLTVLLAAILGLGTFVVLTQWNEIAWESLPAAATALAVGLFVVLVIQMSLIVLGHLRTRDRLLRDARSVRERTRFATTMREKAELGAEGGAGLKAKASTGSERERIERPATLSSLINDFRDLAQLAGEVSGKVLIAIDELDKLEERTETGAQENGQASKLSDLLRDIKGIFDIPRVYFLVSISDEAARSLSLGGLRTRDNFNSSFYTVIACKPATPEQSAELLQDRGKVPRDAALALAVLAGGNPRETLRLAELAGSAKSASEAVLQGLEEEAIVFRREVVTAVATPGEESLSPEARTGVFAHLSDNAFTDTSQFVTLARSALEPAMWEPTWGDEQAWVAEFAEQWQRLLVRLAVGQRLVESTNLVRDEGLELLQDVVIATSQSAVVGKTMLGSGLRLDSREAVAKTDARTRLEGLARNYEQVRGAMVTGPARTEKLAGVVAEIREGARDAAYSSPEIAKLLESSMSGDRVLALGVVQATADRGSLDLLLNLIRAHPSPFEVYHALSALESLRPDLDPNQRHQVRDTLEDPTVKRRWQRDDPQKPLAERLLQSL